MAWIPPPSFIRQAPEVSDEVFDNEKSDGACPAEEPEAVVPRPSAPAVDMEDPEVEDGEDDQVTPNTTLRHSENTPRGWTDRRHMSESAISRSSIAKVVHVQEALNQSYTSSLFQSGAGLVAAHPPRYSVGDFRSNVSSNVIRPCILESLTVSCGTFSPPF